MTRPRRCVRRFALAISALSWPMRSGERAADARCRRGERRRLDPDDDAVLEAGDVITVQRCAARGRAPRSSCRRRGRRANSALLRSRFASTSRTRSISALRPTTGSSSPRAGELGEGCARSGREGGNCFGSSANRPLGVDGFADSFALRISRLGRRSCGHGTGAVGTRRPCCGAAWTTGGGPADRTDGATGTRPLGRGRRGRVASASGGEPGRGRRDWRSSVACFRVERWRARGRDAAWRGQDGAAARGPSRAASSAIAKSCHVGATLDERAMGSRSRLLTERAKRGRELCEPRFVRHRDRPAISRGTFWIVRATPSRCRRSSRVRLGG